MFTGLIEELGTIKNINRGPRSARLVITARTVLEGTKIGDSIAVNGVCLTAVALGSREFAAEVMAETLDRTNLGELPIGEKVNLERAMRLGDRLGGHLVTGHIDGVGVIRQERRVDIARLVRIEAPAPVLKYVLVKGSIAIDGISLTVVDHDQRSLEVSLIPHTAGMTTLGHKRVGDRVNLEGDLLGKYIERLLATRDGAAATGVESHAAGINLDFLARHGF